VKSRHAIPERKRPRPHTVTGFACMSREEFEEGFEALVRTFLGPRQDQDSDWIVAQGGRFESTPLWRVSP
jgi:hypothetical protein